MAARKSKIRHDDETRAKIQAAQIINRLHACVMGKVELSPAQVSSAKTLLAKVLPDLQAVELNAQVNNTIQAEPLSPDDWANKHSVGTAAGSPARPN